MRTLVLALGGLLLAAGPAAAVDYDKADRTIKKEPAYKKAPEYGLLLFGPQARLRVWVVLDGDTLYLDRDGDGDLTGPGERFADSKDCKGVELADPDGRTRYLITGVSAYSDGK